MDLFSKFFRNLVERGLEYFRRYYGTYRGTCMAIDDPDEQGRIKVRVPIVTGKDTHPKWAWPIMPMAGKDKGTLWVPDVGDPVYVRFENGDPRYPMYEGGWWPKPKGENYTPSDAYTYGIPSKRIFRTKAGHELSFEDNAENFSVKLIWHNPDIDKYSFISITKDA